MAIYGIGAYFDGEWDVSGEFIANNIVAVGWGIDNAPELHQYLRSLKVGDIVYIKAAYGGGDITVKGIGIIKDNEIREDLELAPIARNVKWLNTEKFVIPKPQEKNNVRSNTIYEEFHPEILKLIIERIK